MSLTRRTLLTDGLTSVVVELSEKEIERMQTDAEYCQQVINKHSSATTTASTNTPNNEQPSPVEAGTPTETVNVKPSTEGLFQSRRRAFKAPWDSEMTHFFISEYRNVRGIVVKKREAFLLIAEKMNSKGYDVTPYTVEKKWHNLIKTYKNVLDRALHKGQEKICWEYFEEMDEIIKSSTPSLPAPGNLKNLAKARKVSGDTESPNVHAPQMVESLSVSPDIGSCPPSPELIITTPRSSSPPRSDTSNNYYQNMSMSNSCQASTPSSHVPSYTSPTIVSSSAVVSSSSAPTLQCGEPQNMSTCTVQYDQSMHPNVSSMNPQMANSPAVQVASKVEWSAQIPSQVPNNMDVGTQVIATQQNMSAMQHAGMASAAYITVPEVQSPRFVKPSDPLVKNNASSQGGMKRRWPSDHSLNEACHSKQEKIRVSTDTPQFPDPDLLSAQRETNYRLKTLNSNITSMGNTLNENILGLKRAVESMVSIMLQNRNASVS
ncbi:hypothetical protein SK128_007858 [Halocaridina rubra]|uniref:Myb/SANT-like DNA-binding domain-containing protein n=1 Tax=Halocaridina rubra TaxID=373956 RepID=A0AAN8X2P7_HALRR